MGKTLNVFIGIILVLAALTMLVLNPLGIPFLESLVTLVIGSIPPILGMMGLILLFIGLDEMRSESAAKVRQVEQVSAPPISDIGSLKEPVYEIHRSKKKKK